MKTPPIKIDPEFRDYMPAVEGDDLEQLLIRDGCRDKLIVWKEEGLLVDGHRRYRICEKKGIGYQVAEKSFASRDDVLNFIDELAVARRNLSPDELSLRRGRIYNRLKKPAGANLKRGDESPKDQSDTSGNTAEKVAKAHGVSAPTIKRDGEFAAAVDKLKDVAPDITKDIAAGKAPPKAKVIKAAKADTPKEAKAILAGKEPAAKTEPPPAPKKNGSEVVGAKERRAAAKAFGELKRVMASWPGHIHLRPHFEAIANVIHPTDAKGEAA